MQDKRVTKTEPEKWGPCPKGEWQHLTEALRSRRRKVLTVNIIAIVATAAIVAGVTWPLASPPPSDPGPTNDQSPHCAPCPSSAPAHGGDSQKAQK